MEKHLSHYILLFVGLLLAVIPMILLAHNYALQTMAAGAASLLFAAWGIGHHVSEGRFRWSVVCEYVLYGVVVFFIIFTVLSLF